MASRFSRSGRSRTSPRRLPGDGDADQHSRYMEVVVPGDRGVVRIACLYLPNGNPIGTDKFAYKLDWMDRLTAPAGELLGDEEALVLAGDFNVIPTPHRRQAAGALGQRCAVPARDPRRATAR